MAMAGATILTRDLRSMVRRLCPAGIEERNWLVAGRSSASVDKRPIMPILTSLVAEGAKDAISVGPFESFPYYNVRGSSAATLQDTNNNHDIQH